ncbi:choice-of-anchor G family protein, partial [Microbacterium karelineae]|uniref:choice-of-anchor G family protein n=1 Tax=Microbacterium karelineae TaxID=2654283 RepID=UPI0012EA746D
MRRHIGRVRQNQHWSRRRLGKKAMAGVAVGVVGAMVGSANVAMAAGVNTYPDDLAEAEASFLELALAGDELIGLGASEAGFDTNPGPNQQPFSGEIAGTDIVDFGSGFTIPLDQLLAFGELSALLSQSTASDSMNAEGLASLAGADGAVALDSVGDADFGNATIDLLSLFDAAGIDGITDQMIDVASIEVGVAGAWEQAIDGVIQDPDGVGGLGQYRLADMLLQVHSPAIETAADGLSDAVGQIEDQLLGLIEDGLGLTELFSVIPGTSVTASIDSNLQQDVLDAVLLAPISTDDGLATINLGDGSLTFDLGRFGGNDDGVRDGPVGLNNQDPNTELVDDETYPFIASSIHDVIEVVLDVAWDAVLESLQTVTISIDVEAPDGTTAGVTTNLTGETLDSYCNPSGITGAVTCATLTPILSTIAGLTSGIVSEILNADPNPLYEIFETVKTDLITVPVRAAVDPFLEILTNFISLQINHQPEPVLCTTPGGEELVAQHEVSALSLGVLGGAARLGLGNAGVRIDACGVVAAVGTLEATSPEPAGGETEVTGSGWAADTEVSLQLTDPDGLPVGDAVPVTTDADGNIPAGTVLPIPADAVPSPDYSVVGTEPGGEFTEAPLEVYAPDLTAETPVNPGQCTAITSGGWIPGSDVTLQLTDAAGAPVGDELVVTVDADGNVPADTCVTVPEGTEAGDYTVVGTDDNGAEVSAPVEVVEVGTPILDATSPVPAGGETEVTGSDWAPDTEVSLQLTDPAGEPVGDPVPATTDADGNIPAGTMVPVPEGSEPGDYTVVGTDPDDNTASAPLEVYAPAIEATSPVEAGDDTTVTGSGWIPESPVELQLTDPAGLPVGDPVPVTTDADGNIPADTLVPVPADAEPGDYTVVGTDENGAEVSAPLEVLAPTEPVVEIEPNVPAGTCAEITSSGWAPNSTVTFTLVNETGEEISTVTFDTDADGNVVGEPVCIEIPEGTEPGDHTVIGED